MKEIIKYLEKQGKMEMANELILANSKYEKLVITNANLKGFSDYTILQLKTNVSRDRIMANIISEAKKRKLV